MRYIFPFLLILGLTGCGNSPDDDPNDYHTLCIDGVTYIFFKRYTPYQGFGYMSVQLDRDSKIVPCQNLR